MIQTTLEIKSLDNPELDTVSSQKNSPIAWLSKKQATIDTSMFEAEFVAMMIGIETLGGLRYKLHMMGVPILGLSLIYGDNMSVIHNTQRPDSTLNKKSN